MSNRLNNPRVLVLTLSALLLGAAAAGGCATDRQVIAQANDVHQGLEPAVIEDPVVANYIQQVGDRIIDAARRYTDETGGGPKAARNADNSWIFQGGNLKFHIVNSKTLNAFTTGGEHMYVYNQLFQECTSEDELAAVMSHEFAHVYLRHVQSGINRQYASLAAALGAGAAGYAAGGSAHGQEYGGAFAGAAQLATQFIGAGYTREDENEADKIGFAIYVRAGWDPNKFADFFKHMISKGLDTTNELLSDHPSLARRVENTQERINRLDPRDVQQWRRPPVADAAQFRRIQQQAMRDAATTPSDQQLAKAQTLLSAFPSCVTPDEQPDQKAAQQRLVTTLQRDAQKNQGKHRAG
jgi:predicted Zn-dependent protease